MSKAAINTKNFAWFLEKVSLAKERLLMLDYDGTLAPFCSDRHRASPYPQIPHLLHRIMKTCRTRLIIISERAAQEVVPLLGLEPTPEIWGVHGLERRHPDSRYEQTNVSDEAVAALGQAETSLVEAGLERLLEIKLAAVAVHWRSLRPAESLRVRTKAYRILQPLASRADLLLADFEEGVELRLRSANKGEAVRTLLSEIKPNVPVAYLGDDITDEAAFRTLNGRGLTVLVRPTYRFTAAQTWLRPPVQVVEFLTDWIRVAGGEP